MALMVLFSSQVWATTDDRRFVVEINQQDGSGLDMNGLTELALPILWKRVVPAAEFEKAMKLPAKNYLLLQFKPVRYGVRMVFNATLVEEYLRRNGIAMLTQYPNLNLRLSVQNDQGELAQDLQNYAYAISDEFGFLLSPSGRTLKVELSAKEREDGQPVLHAELQGAYTTAQLQAADMPYEGFASFQMQSFLHQILLEVRDAYGLGELARAEAGSELILEIHGNHTLATQVMLEQALQKYPAVTEVVPVLLQKSRRQYRLKLRDSDESWVKEWFAKRRLQAEPQADGRGVDWLIK